MAVQCEGHVTVSDESYGRLLQRYKGDSPGFVAELAKKNAERKLLHEMLSEAGIPSETHQGRELCLLARLALLVARYDAVMGVIDDMPVGLEDLVEEWPTA
jgi:hypothetical protein